MQLIEYLDKGAEAFPDRDVVHDGTQGWTYRQMQALTCRVARALQASGVRHTTHVAGYSPNHPMAFAAQYGSLRSGGVWIPINVRNSMAENVAVLNAMDVEFLFFHSKFSDDVRAAREQLPRIRSFVCVDRAVDFAPSLEDWCSASSDAYCLPDKGPLDIVSMLTTSGTTGTPKGVMLTNQVWETVIACHQIGMPQAPESGPPVNIVAAPMTHAAGTYAATMLSQGCTNVLLEKADPLGVMQAIHRFRGTTVFLPPTVIYMMLAHPERDSFDFSSLRYLFYGAAPMSPTKLREAIQVFGPVMHQGFGQSEAPILTFLTPRDHVLALESEAALKRLQSCGRELALVRVAIMDEQGRLMPPGERGEIVVRSSLVMKGYYKNDSATIEVSGHGWHHTGDVGYKDEDGYLYIVDRKRDMIITGGFNVFPAEVEKVILEHPAIQECAVVGVPDDKWGEAVLAAVELKAGATLSVADLQSFCREALGGVKTPKRFEVMESIPRTPTGKVMRREVRARYWQDSERAI